MSGNRLDCHSPSGRTTSACVRRQGSWRQFEASQVSFLEQLAFIAQHIHDDVPKSITDSTWRNDIQPLLLKSGKYFDRLLEVDGPGYNEGMTKNSGSTHADARRHFLSQWIHVNGALEPV